MTAAGLPTRVIASGPHQGEAIVVATDTHIAGTLAFASGAVISICTSFDVWKHGHGPLELYGEEGSMRIPDPNHFGGPVSLSRRGGDWEEVPLSHGYADGDYRGIGVADLAHAIRSGRPQHTVPGPRRGAVVLGRRRVVEGLVRPLFVVDLLEVVEAAVLSCGRGGVPLARSRHSSVFLVTWNLPPLFTSLRRWAGQQWDAASQPSLLWSPSAIRSSWPKM